MNATGVRGRPSTVRTVTGGANLRPGVGAMSVSQMFIGLQGVLTADQDIREVRAVPKKCQKAREHFNTVKIHLASLKTKFPADQYYSMTLVSLKMLIKCLYFNQVFFHTDFMNTGVEAEREKGFHLDIEDYLSGVLTLASELSRLAVNSVTAGDYCRPLRISAFINELDSGFRLLNLKNDSLRKRYDGLKYDVKKIEEVVYDLSIRGLSKTATGGAGEEK
ncbi:hypothetical protein Chor_016059 [Crotalus horridus]